MALDKKSALVLIIFGLISTCLTLYAVRAHAVARYAYDDESGFGWRYAPSGSFLPWPREPGMLTALSKMTETDLFIYRYLVKSWVLVGCATALWIITFLYLVKALTKAVVTEEKPSGVK